MLGFIIQESLELTWVTCKLAVRCVRRVYRYLVPPKQNLMLIELQELQAKLQDITNRVENS